MVDIYYPEISTSRSHVRNFFRNTPAKTSDVLAEEFKGAARFGIDALNTVAVAVESSFGDKVLTEEEYKDSSYFREGIAIPKGGFRESIAKLTAESYDRRFKRNLTLNRARNGLATGALRFGASMAGSLLDPVNIGLGITAPLAVGASATARTISARAVSGLSERYGVTAGRVAAGAGESTAGALVFEPLALSAAKIQQDPEYGLFDTFVNLTAGALIGGVLTGVGGKFSDKLSRVSPETNMQATRVAASQLMEGKEVDVSPVYNGDPEVGPANRAELAASDARAWEKLNNPIRKKKRVKKIERYPESVRRAFVVDKNGNTKKPTTITQFVISQGKIDPTFRGTGEAGDLNERLDSSSFRVKKIGSGVSLEQMTLKAQEQGYFGSEHANFEFGQLSAYRLINALEDDASGRNVFSALDPDVAEYEAALRYVDELEEFGIDPLDMTQDELDAELQLRQSALDDYELAYAEKVRESGLTDEEAEALVERVEADPDDPSTYMALSSEEESLEAFDELRSGALFEADRKRFESSSSEINALDNDIAKLDQQRLALQANNALSDDDIAMLAEYDAIISQYNEIDDIVNAGAMCVIRG